MPRVYVHTERWVVTSKATLQRHILGQKDRAHWYSEICTVETSLRVMISILYRETQPEPAQTCNCCPLEVWLTCGAAILGVLLLRLATHLETDRSQQSRGRNCPSKQLPLLASRSDFGTIDARSDRNARSLAFVETLVALISNASWPPSAHRAKNISRVQQRAHTAGGCLYFGLLLPPFVEAHQIDSSAMEVEVAVYAG